MEISGLCWCHLRHLPRHVFNDYMLIQEAKAEVAKHGRG
jgi:hypothetical protein